MEQAVLALEDGTVFEGTSFGAPAQRTGEVVFNTAITGYQEIFTDPSYCGQIVVLTNPQIGNYGANSQDFESVKPFIEGLVVREISPVASNWRSGEKAEHFLAKYGIPVIADVDTRKLVRLLRDRGAMRGVIAVGEQDRDQLIEAARRSPSMTGQNLVARVTTSNAYPWTEAVAPVSPSDKIESASEPCYHVVAYDYGIKRNILRHLVQIGSRLTVVPADTSADDVLALKPDGVFLSNGPGDPEPLEHQATQVRKLIGRVPVFGICLGHQILGLAFGGKTYKLKFGHHGANHPVLNQLTGKVEITSQNHGFCVDPGSLRDSEVEITHMNLNDQTVEGFRHRSEPVFCVQYHPEAAPGPHDSHYLFRDFAQAMKEHKS
ncbi:MAG TPA: glutamine-hydrolyzing carbamoyl-phosphate synthase small subunit [Bryobacteraceae bacterium]|nr:glutamine-hydrolyzing carbamoyl-phosphate synthase small subunit [Bryobacteraceae bacterium]